MRDPTLADIQERPLSVLWSVSVCLLAAIATDVLSPLYVLSRSLWLTLRPTRHARNRFVLAFAVTTQFRGIHFFFVHRTMHPWRQPYSPRNGLANGDIGAFLVLSQLR